MLSYVLQSLLASHEQAGEFIAASAMEVAAKTLGDAPVPSRVGEKIGPYEILSLLGAGGMKSTWPETCS
jgi:hypothetical protein